MATPDFILELRRYVGHTPLWLTGTTAVVVRDGTVLLVRRADTGLWTPVTGIVDPGEHPADAAIRETREETGVECVVERLASVAVTGVYTYANGDQAQYLDHTFRCSYVGGDAHVADDESQEVGWFALAEIPAMPAEYRARLDAALADEVAPRLVR